MLVIVIQDRHSGAYKILELCLEWKNEVTYINVSAADFFLRVKLKCVLWVWVCSVWVTL